MRESFCLNVEPPRLIDEGFCLDAGAGGIARCPVGVQPSLRHASGHALAGIACALRDQVERSADTFCRLVGVDLTGFLIADSGAA